jgi:hypothetical protein
MVTEPLLLSLVRSIVKGEKDVPFPLPNEAQVDWGIRTGLGPILYELALAAPNPISRPLVERLLISELAAKIAHWKRTTAINNIIDACSSSEISIIPLKGILICNEYYRKPYWRPMQDIDFLVAEEDLGRTESVLESLGYQQASPRPADFYYAHHHSMPFRHPSTEIVVEVHTGLFPSWSPLSEAFAFQSQNIATQLRPADFHGRPIYRLSFELELVYLSCHAVRERRIFGSLIPFLDLAFLLRHTGPELNWSTIFAWLDNRTVSAYVCVMLSYLEKHRLVELPRAVQLQLSDARKRLGNFALNVILRDIDRYAASGKSTNDVLGRDQRIIIWDILLAPRAPVWNILLVPWYLAFPPSNPNRFRIQFQFARLRSAFRRVRK